MQAGVLVKIIESLAHVEISLNKHESMLDSWGDSLDHLDWQKQLYSVDVENEVDSNRN